MEELINHPSHYSHDGGMECIDMMVQAFGPESVIEFCKLNAFKYVFRAGSKVGAPEAQDLRKAVWYLNRAADMIDEEMV